MTAFRAGLREGGYVEGDSVAIEYRWAQGQYDRLPRLAAELVGWKVSVIVSVGGAERAAKAATATVPIVFVTGYDPVADGTVASLSRPGGNLTGVSMLTTFLETKRLGLLHDLVPKATTIAVLIDEHFPGSAIQRDQVTKAARTIGLSIHLLGASTDRELDEVFGSTAPARDQALLVPGSPFYDTRRDRIVAAAERLKIPAMYQFREYATAGGLISYGIDLENAYREAGRYTVRVLRGEKPADLPILQPTKFNTVINLKTAKALGLTIPPGVLAIADEVIE